VIQSPQQKPPRSMAQVPQMTTPEMLKSAKAYIKQYSPDHDAMRWALSHMALSLQCIFDEVVGSSGPTRAADKGIEHMKEALKEITEEHPMFGTAQLGLARLYPKRVSGNRTANLTKALACAETALRDYENPCWPCPVHAVAEVYAIIGSIYADADFESSDSRAANDDLAIRHYLASLQRSSMYDDNDYWVDAQMKVGRIYFTRKNGKRRSNLKVAIKHLVEALKVFTKSKNLNKWANTHKCLAMSYNELFETANLASNLAKVPEEGSIE
jgi:hypothetical protein